MPKKLFIRKIDALFIKIQSHPYYQKMNMLPYPVKIFLACIFLCLGVLGIIFPVIPGLPLILLGCILIGGISIAKKYIFRGIYFTRLHILLSRIYNWWKAR